jgi:hypothetical protein
MRNIFKIFIIVLIFSACNEKQTDKYPIQKVDWNSKQTNIENFDNLIQGKSYLPVYSHIYHVHENRTSDLTITISIRNVSMTDSVYVLKADYFNTTGENIRQYLSKPIYLKPLETLEIIIEEKDIEGGSGANFMFDWAIKNVKNPPLFEAVMISGGQQGLSYITRGVQVFE